MIKKNELEEILGVKRKEEEGGKKEREEPSQKINPRRMGDFWIEQLGKNVLVRNYGDDIVAGKLIMVDFASMGVVLEVEENYVVVRGSNVRTVTIPKNREEGN